MAKAVDHLKPWCDSRGLVTGAERRFCAPPGPAAAETRFPRSALRPWGPSAPPRADPGAPRRGAPASLRAYQAGVSFKTSVTLRH